MGRNGRRVTAIMVYSERCPHCRRMKPIFGELASERDDVLAAYIRAEENAELLEKMGIEYVPTFIVRCERERRVHVGALPKEKLDKLTRCGEE